MNLALAIVLATAAAVSFGVATAVQHDEASNVDAPFVALLRNARWWAGTGADVFGFVLQLAALAFGPVVLVQPFLILCLPIALPIRARFGGPSVTRSDLAASLLMVAGLSGFFVLAGNPRAGDAISATTSATISIVALAVGGAIVAAVARRPGAVRAVSFGAVAGAWFGIEAVLVNATSSAYDADGGWSAFGHLVGLIPLAGAIVVGLIGFALSQAAFRAGSLGASLPMMLVVDPVVAVLVGAFVLHEHVSMSGPRAVGYALCLAAIAVATARLADSDPAPSDPVSALGQTGTR